MSNCARVGSPNGGIKDEIPPVVEKSKPVAGQLGYDDQRMRIFFDEIVVLKSLNDHFLVSPPTEKKPEVTAYGKELTVEFEDTLQANTTYTLYFGDAIVDNNEGNVLHNYTFSFSTGFVMDTMRLQGYVINAETLDPEVGILVGIYANQADSAFTNSVPMRIAKTNEEGWFSVNNVSPGSYKVRALGEMVTDFRFNQTGEIIAFSQDVFTTSQETITLMDSVFLDSIGEDDEHILVFKELSPRDTIMYYPDDIILMSFAEAFVFQTLSEKKRDIETRLDYTFNSKIVEEPKIRLLDDTLNTDWNISEISDDSLTISYWVKDSALYNLDTIAVLFEYQVTDSLQRYVWKEDTLQMRFKRKKKSERQQRKDAKQAEKDKEEGKVEKIPALKLNFEYKGSVPYFEDYKFVSEQPIASIRDTSIRLFEIINDSTMTPLKFKFEKDTETPRSYRMVYRWDEGKTYQLIIDSASIYDIYGLTNDSIGQKISVVGEEKFSTIIMNLKNMKGVAMVSLLDSKQEVVETQRVTPELGEAVFFYLKPSKYYVSLFYDTNDNGLWDPGEYSEQRQAEERRFFSKMIEAKAYYEMEEDWDVEGAPIREQKPKDLKPKEKK